MENIALSVKFNTILFPFLEQFNLRFLASFFYPPFLPPSLTPFPPPLNFSSSLFLLAFSDDKVPN